MTEITDGAQPGSAGGEAIVDSTISPTENLGAAALGGAAEEAFVPQVDEVPETLADLFARIDELSTDGLIHVKPLADLLEISPKTLARWEKNGKITAFKTLGGHRRFWGAEIKAALLRIYQERGRGSS